VVDRFDDPNVEGVACHIARAQTGGVKGALGVAEDTSDASIAGEGVFDERRSLVFKTFASFAFSIEIAMFWFMLPTAIALSKAARKTA
jgi:catabolite regulation protein CreA